MPPQSWRTIENCCGCIPDLRTASAIIAVLALVTNPLLSWLIIRHTYAMRVSCYLTSTNRVDIVDLNINNVISFGFGVNAALGNSCVESQKELESHEASLSSKIIQGLGWVALAADGVLFITSLVFLLRIFKHPIRRPALVFMASTVVAMVVSTLYGILHVVMCGIRGKGLALCELVLTFFDLVCVCYWSESITGAIILSIIFNVGLLSNGSRYLQQIINQRIGTSPSPIKKRKAAMKTAENKVE